MARRANDELVRNPRSCRVIVLEELDFVFDRPELSEIAEIWNNGFSVKTIAKKFKRDPDEILLALIHLAKKEKIERRNSGLGGKEE